MKYWYRIKLENKKSFREYASYTSLLEKYKNRLIWIDED